MRRAHQPGGTFCGLRSAVPAGSGNFCRHARDSRRPHSRPRPNLLIAWQLPNYAARDLHGSTLLLASASARHDDCNRDGGAN
jgi:hypothetical protein